MKVGNTSEKVKDFGKIKKGRKDRRKRRGEMIGNITYLSP